MLTAADPLKDATALRPLISGSWAGDVLSLYLYLGFSRCICICICICQEFSHEDDSRGDRSREIVFDLFV